MKVFISHKNIDSYQAVAIQRAFVKKGVETYLDVLDPSVNGGGKTLTDHIKSNLNQCTDIIVVMSESTITSWWVPFEIGMSAQVNMPTASYLKDVVALPDYLSYWPRLSRIEDIDKYVSVRMSVGAKIHDEYSMYSSDQRKIIETRVFYDMLKKELR